MWLFSFRAAADRFSFHQSLGMEDIRHQGQELVENINRSRNADQTFMDDYQEKFVEKVQIFFF